MRILVPDLPFDAAALCRAADIAGFASLPWETVRPAHERYVRLARLARVKTRSRALAAAWLDGSVDAEIAAAWKTGPEAAFWLHAVARSLCMRLAAALVPELERLGCAPWPGPDPQAIEALGLAGLPCRGGDALMCARQYAVITPMPFAGGCAVCSLAATCPRAAGQTGQPDGAGGRLSFPE